MTTVGFGDITPHTDLGRLLASLMMLMGWGVLAVPNGIVTAEMVKPSHNSAVTARTCPACLRVGLGLSDRFCRSCSEQLPHGEHNDRGQRSAQSNAKPQACNPRSSSVASAGATMATCASVLIKSLRTSNITCSAPRVSAWAAAL